MQRGHAILAALRVPAVTTNYDPLYEQAAASAYNVRGEDDLLNPIGAADFSFLMMAVLAGMLVLYAFMATLATPCRRLLCGPPGSGRYGGLLLRRPPSLFFGFFQHIRRNVAFDDVLTVVAFEDVRLHFDKVDNTFVLVFKTDRKLHHN